MQGQEIDRNRIGMHVQNIEFKNTGFLSTWVFGSQELEEQRNGKKHGQIKVKPYESTRQSRVESWRSSLHE